MYIVDNIAYAGEPTESLKVVSIKALPDYCLWLSFNNMESREFDFKPLLDKPCYKVLKDSTLFGEVSLDHGIPVWCDGDIDIAPEFIFNNCK